MTRKIWYYEDEIESLVGVERFIAYVQPYVAK